MSTRNATVRFLGLFASAAVVLVAWATVGATRTAAGPSPHMNSGLVGITFGQMVRFNVTNTGDTRGMIIDGCRFTDANGNTLKEFRARQVLAIGQSASFDLEWPDLIDRGGRIEANAQLRFVGKSDDLVTTTQVIDLASGESRMGWNNHNETLVHAERPR